MSIFKFNILDINISFTSLVFYKFIKNRTPPEKSAKYLKIFVDSFEKIPKATYMDGVINLKIYY